MTKQMLHGSKRLFSCILYKIREIDVIQGLTGLHFKFLDGLSSGLKIILIRFCGLYFPNMVVPVKDKLFLTQ